DQRSQEVADRFDHGADNEITEQGQDAAQDAGGEVVDQHFEADGNLILDSIIPLGDEPAAKRAHQHGAQEHGNLGANNHAHGGRGANNAATLLINQVTSGKTDQNRQEVDNHRPDQLCEILIGDPARGNKQGRNQAPGDEGPNVGD